MNENSRLTLNQYSLGALDGFLRGLSFFKSAHGSLHLSAGEFNVEAQQEWHQFFNTIFQQELDIIEYTEKSLTKNDCHQELMAIIKQLDLPYVSDDQFKRLHIQLIEAIEDVVVDENNNSLFWSAWRKLLIQDISLKFVQGGINRYLIFQLSDKYFFILITRNA